MMDLVLATSGGEAQAAGGGYVDDVFSAYTYTGNGSTQTINNGIDLAGKGGMVWIKGRDQYASFGSSTYDTYHALFDTSRGIPSSNGSAGWLSTNGPWGQADFSGFGQGLASFNSNGFSLLSNGTINGYKFGQPSGPFGAPYISWTFRKSPKFFDVVTYTGNGASNRALSHQLNADVGMIMVKATSTTGDWWVFHRSATGDLVLNTTSAQTASKANIPSATSSTFTVNGSANTNGVQYVAYLFAHDPSADGIIQCGSFTTDVSGNATVNLGWEPQYLMFKKVTFSDWKVLDVSRGWSLTASQVVYPNQSWAEEGGLVAPPNSLGFSGGGFGGNDTYIYLAIRRPNKPPTSGTEVYNAIARTGTGAAATVTGVGFAPDLVNIKSRSTGSDGKFFDRLRGASYQILTSSTGAEQNFANTVTSFDTNGISLGSDGGTAYVNTSGDPVINHFFRRAKGFFDVVCDSGTGVAHGVNHGLSVAPEFVIRKSRSGATQWECWHSALAATEKLVLNSTAAKVTDATAWNSTLPTSTQFTVGTGANVNTNAATYVTYLFATLAGISKVGSYTGNGSSQTIDCGFATGARFILIKRTDATGDWYVWDSVRGIIAANDPHLSLNTTAAEVTTDDSADPDASGFIVNQNTATNINVSGGQYIFLAIA